MASRHALLVAMLLMNIAAYAETLTGTVVGVADGDTVTVLDAQHQQRKIRRGDIDAPEKAQAFVQRSKESMWALVFGKEFSGRRGKHDRWCLLSGWFL